MPPSRRAADGAITEVGSILRSHRTGCSVWGLRTLKLIARIGVVVCYAVLAPLFVASLIGAGFGILYWFDGVSIQLSAPGRVGLLVLALVIYAAHLLYWSKNHGSAFTINPDTDVVSGTFNVLTDAEAKSDFESAYKDVYERFNLGNSEQSNGLIRQLVKQSFRRRVHERVEIVNQEICHDITFNLWTNKWKALPEGGLLVAVTRLEKQSPYEQLSLCDKDGKAIEVVNYRHAMGVLYGLIRSQIEPYKLFNPNLDECKILTELAALIAAPVITLEEEKRRQRIYTDVTGDVHKASGSSPDNNILLWTLLTIALERRPVLAIVPNSSSNTNSTARESVITLRYRERLQSTGLPEGLRRDWWRRWRQSARTRIGLTPAQFFLKATRARSASTYKMTFTAPTGAYIHEARAYSDDQNKWIPILDKHAYYNTFVGWTDPKGRSQSSMGCRLLNKTKIKDLRFYVRLRERPPGRVGSALVVALAAMIIVWIAGFVAEAAEKPDNNVDVVALTLAFPGVLAVWLSVTGPAQLGPFRSIPAFISMLVSGLVSVCSIVLYMANTSNKFEDTALGAERSFFFMEGKLWSVLLAIAMVNFIGIASVFLIAVHRYMGLIAPQKKN